MHQDLPFEQVVELVQPARSLSHSPLFQVMFAWQNNEQVDLTLPGLVLSSLAGGEHATAKFDLTLDLSEIDGRIVGALEYASALFDRTTAERFGRYLVQLLQAMAEAGEATPVASLAILPDAERLQVIEGFNATAVDYPAHALVHELFEEQVAKAPDAIAVVYEDDSLTYGELDRRANRLAHHLANLGIKPDDRVAICVERSIEMVVGLLAILKAGGAYVPLDPAYPPDRLAYMLEDCNPVAILTHAPARNALEAARAGMEGQDTGAKGQGTAAPVIDLVADAFQWADLSANAPDIRSAGMTSANLAYVIYTSGSTGLPKGVMVEHKGLVNVSMAQRAMLNVTPTSNIVQFASISFDAASFEIFMALLNRAALHLPQKLMLPSAIAEFIRERGITHATLPPAVITQLPSEDGPLPLNTLVLAGEAVRRQAVERSSTAHQIVNAYGPTEATIWATSHYCDPSYDRDPVIGRPIANTRIYILDGRGEPVPVGVAGELHIGGAGVARGYLNRPELTAERFVADPYAGVAGARMYRTGDLGRWLADGTIEYLGRNDFQVKIRGFRIELGEIEARLASHPGVGEAVVVARQDGDEQDGQGADKRLVAYYTRAADAGRDLSAEALRSHLSAVLPDYMVPSAYVLMEAFPLTPNGKLDRKALPAPDGDAYARQVFEAPQGEIEATIAAVWSELLGVETISRNDSFFALGGHSLLAVRMIARLSEQGMAVDIRGLFTQPVLKDLA
ncbi:non-ribosomal peptide synthetase, partial [Rhizobium leguminosarum]|uniref:non-ribosomal peptide synthetase n=1 Tax=Rhizobium leguminosarum TaxID=384 RepID=UPI001FE05903